MSRGERNFPRGRRITEDLVDMPAPRLVASQQNGSAGGRELAARTSGEQRAAWSAKGGQSVLARYGRDYFRHIRQIGIEKKRQLANA